MSREKALDSLMWIVANGCFSEDDTSTLGHHMSIISDTLQPLENIEGLKEALGDCHIDIDDGGNITIVSSYSWQTHAILCAARKYLELTK